MEDACAKSTRRQSIFIPNYDGRVQEPTVPAEPVPETCWPTVFRRHCGRYGGTNMPATQPARASPKRCSGALDNFRGRTEEATLAAGHGTDPRAPTSLPPGLIVGQPGQSVDAYTTGPRVDPDARGVVEVEEDSRRAATSLGITELPYQVQPRQTFITSICRAGPRRAGLAGIANIEDQSSDRVGLRIVRRGQARRGGQGWVLNNLLQAHPAADQLRRQTWLSIVDGGAAGRCLAWTQP